LEFLNRITLDKFHMQIRQQNVT